MKKIEKSSQQHSGIHMRGVRQNTLKNLDLDIPHYQITVITGVSGSGKSSLAFDTLYAEGQRRYIETFSPYARQFLDRMDKPQADSIEGIPPAIAIQQSNTIRNSRSTVGTMTEITDLLKVLFARFADIYCESCATKIQPDNSSDIYHLLQAKAAESAQSIAYICFPVVAPADMPAETFHALLAEQGYTKIYPYNNAPTNTESTTHYVVQDRFRLKNLDEQRVLDAVQSAFHYGKKKCHLFIETDTTTQHFPYSQMHHCARCDITYDSAQPHHFSFNSPVGACERCKGFGRVIGIDYQLVIPDSSKTLRQGAIKPWQTPSFQEAQVELEGYALKAGVRMDTRWEDLTEQEKKWVIGGDPHWKGTANAWKTQWYGIQRFFDWLESKAYKMHIRVLLSKYRSYSTCPDCLGARLKPAAQLWRVGSAQAATDALPITGKYPRFRPLHTSWSTESLYELPGLCMQDVLQLPLNTLLPFIQSLSSTFAERRETNDLLQEIRQRVQFLCDVGLPYLTLDRQSRTLSGGEVQRINLTTALGTSLVNTLFVLDEPSIGLHPRDSERIIGVMQHLRDRGNTLVVVEHDPQFMFASDHIIDMGPGPGERGGNCTFQGPPSALLHAATLTAQYLRGEKKIPDAKRHPIGVDTPCILLQKVNQHNLQNIDVRFPLGSMVAVTGVSGSGKSTLIEEVLYPALCRAKNIPCDTPIGSFQSLLGEQAIAEVHLIDQSALGKTTRSNPVSYVGAYDDIRQQFALAPEAIQRGYTASTFSFNAGNGRCPHCKGTGFEHIEMQFLSDVYIRCAECDGTRFTKEVREITIQGNADQPLSIDQVLSLTVAEAMIFFKDFLNITHSLNTLIEVGLEYVQLGQPVPTLSGGEAQRLKLAGHLAVAFKSSNKKKAVVAKPFLFLFDEPTTGLHFSDVAQLLQVFRKLVAAGHSLIIIEHNLDVIYHADWVIDLGPEGGSAGGQIVFEGTPLDLVQCTHSHTGKALQTYLSQLHLTPSNTSNTHTVQEQSIVAYRSIAPEQIVLENAREHNLKNVQVQIPHDTFTVITGVSGSGKSTLAFDILFHEGQRRYLETINAYARSIVQPANKPDIDHITGIPPTIAIEQRTSRGGLKSTVATMTEIYHFLRLLYVKLGTPYCPSCQVPVAPLAYEQLLQKIAEQYDGKHITLLASVVKSRKGLYTDLAKNLAKKGVLHLRVDGEWIPTKPWPRLDRFKEHTIEMPVGSVLVSKTDRASLHTLLTSGLEIGKGSITLYPDELTSLIHQTSTVAGTVFSTERNCPQCARNIPEIEPRLFSYNSSHGWCSSCFGNGKIFPEYDTEQSGEEAQWLEYEGEAIDCTACEGSRLNAIARSVYWNQRSLPEIGNDSIEELQQWFSKLTLDEREMLIAEGIVKEIQGRLGFLMMVGLNYLTLNRSAPTLSGGEAQRIRLAAQLGTSLQGVCYILDEPTIGLHPRDNHILLQALLSLRAKGNTVVVVEHDEDTIRAAEHIIDIGPGAGVRGGEVIATGTLEEIMQHPTSQTATYLRTPIPHPLKKSYRFIAENHPLLTIHQAQRHNLQKLDAALPLQRFCVVTGVSGSGKSTLIRDVLLPNLQRTITSGKKETPAWQHCTAISGYEPIQRVLEVDQTPIGKTPRSCPATYIGFWDDIRKLYANSQGAKIRGWSAARFSFNTGDGRCLVCQGQGYRTIEMNFLPDVKILCESCHGQRFNPDTLSITYREKSIGEILQMDVDTAIPFFENHPKIQQPLLLMQEVGLGYLTLGQASPTLSGGEAQRLKLVYELNKARIPAYTDLTTEGFAKNHTLYILDEPSVGLATADIALLLAVLHKLVDAGHSLIIIEHHLDIMAEADWLLDLGPEGGEAGGQLVHAGMLASYAAPSIMKKSHTAQALKGVLFRTD